jgi:PPOX class probable F420-dependent enzyme
MKAMPGPETERFLQEQPNLILATVRRDGAPQVSPLWYLWTGESFLISTIDSTAKWANLGRDPRCSVCVDDPGTGRMVVAYGDARLHAGDVRSATRDIVDKYYPDDEVGAVAHVERILGADDARVIIEVVPEKIIARRLDLPMAEEGRIGK